MTGAAADHPVGLDALEGAYLKAVWLRMGDAYRAPRRVTTPRLTTISWLDDEAIGHRPRVIVIARRDIPFRACVGLVRRMTPGVSSCGRLSSIVPDEGSSCRA